MGDDAELMGEPPLSILDLPAGEVLRIVAQLGIDDKKNVALACKGLCAAVRSQWRILLFNPTSPDLPPPGLAHFSGLHTLVIAAGAPEAARALSREEWEREESFDSAGYAVPPAPDAEAAWPRAHELGALLMEALTGRQGAAAPRRLRLVLGTPELASAAQLQRAAEAHFTAGGAGSLADIFRVVGADALTLTLTLNPGALVERSAAQPAPASLFDAVAAGWCLLDGGLVSTLVSASYPWCGHTHQSDARLEGYSRLEALRFCVNPCDISAVETAAAFAAQIAPQLTSAALPALRELHLGRPLRSDASVALPLHLLQLPRLTLLDVNPRVALAAFSQLTHLQALTALRVALSELEEDVLDHPQDLAALASLPALRALTVATWAVREQQELAALQQLTELHLEHWDGAARLIKPAAPMPNLRGATLDRSPTAQDMRYREDSIFARWALRRAAARLPRVQVLAIGTLGSAPAEVRTLEELRRAAAAVDEHVAPLLAAARELDYLQLNTVVNIMSEELDRRCEEGSVELPARLRVPRAAAAGERSAEARDAAGGDSEMAEGGSDGEGGGSAATGPAGWGAGGGRGGEGGWVWERSVEWITDRLTEVLVAEFHYARVVREDAGGGGGDDGADSAAAAGPA